MTNQISMTNNATTPAEIKEGLKFILSHLTGPQFPRTIMTPRTKQKQVNSIEECLYFFERSQFTDCRINSFYFSYLDFALSWKPDILFIDLDLENFHSKMGLDSALSKTLRNIKQELAFDGNKGQPTVLWSGRGYHILQPIQFPCALEYVGDFENYKKPSELFLRFCKDYLSEGKADPKHNPSFRSCLLKIPGTINPKNGDKVRILQKWNGYRPRVPKTLILKFKKELKKRDIDELIFYHGNKQQHQTGFIYPNDSPYCEWINKLLETPLEDCRKIVTDLILSRYLVKVKCLPFEESLQIITEWLDECDKIRKLDSNFNYRTRLAIKYAQTTKYGPMSRHKMKTDYKDLYSLLANKGVF